MSNIIFICEGSSEKNLVDHVLNPYWKNKGLPITGSVIILGEGNPCSKGSGGDVSVERLKVDLSFAMQSDTNESFFTTVFDFYELHGDWPGQNLISANMSSREKVEIIENSAKELLKEQYPELPLEDRFIPYFMLHEYESLLFTSPEAITAVTKAGKSTDELRKILSDFHSKPEEINTTLSPSERLVRAKANYGKTLHAHRIMLKIGIDAVRAACPHFNEWMTRLESLD